MSEHGTYSRYTKGCRCEPCTHANRVYKQDYYHRVTAPHTRLGKEVERLTRASKESK